MIPSIKYSTFQSKAYLTLFITYSIFILFIMFYLFLICVLFYFPLKYLTKVKQKLGTIKLCSSCLLPVTGSF